MPIQSQMLVSNLRDNNRFQTTNAIQRFVCYSAIPKFTQIAALNSYLLSNK